MIKGLKRLNHEVLVGDYLDKDCIDGTYNIYSSLFLLKRALTSASISRRET